MEDKEINDEDFSFKKDTKKEEDAPVEYTPVVSGDSDFDFKQTREKIDKELDKRRGTDKDEVKSSNITEEIKFCLDVKNDLPDEGFLGVKADKVLIKFKDGREAKKAVMMTSWDVDDVEHVEIVNGLFNIDLRDDANFWFIRSPTVVPSMMDDAKSTGYEIKDCYKPDKRKRELPIWLIVGIVVGAIIIAVMMLSMMM